MRKELQFYNFWGRCIRILRIKREIKVILCDRIHRRIFFSNLKFLEKRNNLGIIP